MMPPRHKTALRFESLSSVAHTLMRYVYDTAQNCICQSMLKMLFKHLTLHILLASDVHALRVDVSRMAFDHAGLQK